MSMLSHTIRPASLQSKQAEFALSSDDDALKLTHAEQHYVAAVQRISCGCSVDANII